MKPEKEFGSFGRYLQSIRLEKKVSLETISAETRIAVSNLQLIEKENLDALPAEVFVRGFLRAFAQAVGADGAEAVRRYDARLKLESDLSVAVRHPAKPSRGLWRHLFLAVVALLGVIVLTLYGFSYFQNRLRPPAASEMNKAGEKAEGEPIHEAQGLSASKGFPTAKSEKYVLTIVALEDVWVKVMIDNQAPNEFNLHSGEHLELEAAEGYNLLIGNAGGCKLTLNGEPVSIPGKIGEVVNLQLP
jgi:cytoskeleton protein RodZ